MGSLAERWEEAERYPMEPVEPPTWVAEELAAAEKAAAANLLNVAPEDIDLDRVQREWERRLDDLLGIWDGITQRQRDQIVDQVRSAITSDDLAAIARVTVTTAEATEALAEAMTDMALAAAQEMSREAGRQNVRIDPVASDSATFAALAGVTTALLAQGLTNSGAREALRRWSPSATGDEVASAVSEHLGSLSDTFVRDNLGGMLTSAQNTGRLGTALSGPTAALYASEQMDKRTCLLPQTLVTTRRGRIRADEVTARDEMLGHSGEWIRPSHVILTSVDESVVRLGLDGESELNVTVDHPVLVLTGGQLAWREAGQVTVGDLMVGEETLQSVGKLRVPDLILGQTQDGVTARREVGVLPLVDMRPQRVPVATICLHDQSPDEEVDGPWADGDLAGEPVAHEFQVQADRPLDAGLQATGDVAVRRAVSAIPGITGCGPEGGRALLAGDDDRRPSAGLAAVVAYRRAAVTKSSAAPTTRFFHATGSERALPGAEVVPVGVAGRNHERMAAVRAGLGGSGSLGTDLRQKFGVRELAGSRAVDGPSPATAGDLLGTHLAGPGRGSDAPALDRAVTSAPSATGDARSTVDTHPVHKLSLVQVTIVERRPYTGVVYDFTVPGDETFWAEGVLVHNCGPCSAINGKWIGNTDDPDIVSKVEAIYPNGGYKACLGGVRCRGAVVAVYRPDQVASGEVV